MISALVAVGHAAWGWIAPAGARLAAWALPWLVPFGGVKAAVRPLLWATLALCIGLGTWWLIGRDPKPAPGMIAVSEVEAQRAQAEAKALRNSAAEMQRTLALRDQAVEELEAEIEALQKQMGALRAQTADPDAVVIPADDAWLRAKRGAAGH